MSEGYKLSKVKEDINKFFDDLSTLTYPQKAIFNIGASTRPNLLDNWYFVGGGSQQGGGQFPINQRGQTSYTGVGYGIDRWNLRYGVTLTLESGGIQISRNSSSSVEMVAQVLPRSSWTRIAGMPVTLSALINGKLGSVSFISPINLDTLFDGPNIVVDNLQVDVYGTPNFNTCGVRFYSDSAAAWTIQAVKLELGLTQTLAYQDEDGNWQLFETPDYGEELAKCQAYLWVPQQKSGFTILGVGHAENANTARVTVFPPVSMRTGGTPTVKISDVSALNLRGSSIVTATGVFVDQATNGTPILLTVEGTFTPGEALDVFLSNSASIEFSREL